MSLDVELISDIVENSRDILTIGVLIPNYNAWELAYQCVQANLSLSGNKLSQIVIIDDCSSTPSPFAAEKFEIFFNQVNLGYASTLNKGMTLLKTDIVLLFDADARPLNQYFEKVIEEFTCEPKLALLGFTTVDSMGKPTQHFHKEPNIWSLVLGQAFYAKFQNLIECRERKICLWSCALAIRKKAFDELGGFDEQFDLYEVDTDLSFRVNKSEWKLKIDWDLMALHEGGSTPLLVSQRLFKFYKNRWNMLKKHGRIKRPQFFRFVILIRLRLELLILFFCGPLIYRNKEVRLDKLRGRKNIIRYCQSNYR